MQRVLMQHREGLIGPKWGSKSDNSCKLITFGEINENGLLFIDAL